MREGCVKAGQVGPRQQDWLTEVHGARKLMGQLRLEHWGHPGASVWNFEGSRNSPAQGPQCLDRQGPGALRLPSDGLVPALVFSALVLSPVYFRVSVSCISASLSGGTVGDGLGPTFPCEVLAPQLRESSLAPGRRRVFGWCSSAWGPLIPSSPPPLLPRRPLLPHCSPPHWHMGKEA